jgi:nucleotide-binding universal stress UspA family protein
MMGGTIICGVRDSSDGRSAAELAYSLGARLGLRLVLVHVVDGVPPGTEGSLTARQRQTGGEYILNAIARELGSGTEKRIVLGDRAEAVAQVAAEEGADIIVLGSRPTGLGGRKLRCTLARELEAATPVPVLVAPPSTRKRSNHRLSHAANGSTGSSSASRSRATGRQDEALNVGSREA